jgi:Holliday junction resolvase
VSKDYDKYENVPEDKKSRLKYVYELLKITKKDIEKIIEEKKKIKELRKNKEIIRLNFYTVPEGISRPRKGKFGFYVPNIGKFYKIMDEYLQLHEELKDLTIITECKIDCKYYLPIPSDMKKIEKVLAEEKYIKGTKKPDWDNLGKGTDMLHKIWLDDALVSDARVRKYYSFKPRIEIRLLYYKNHCNSYDERSISKLIEKTLLKKGKK